MFCTPTMSESYRDRPKGFGEDDDRHLGVVWSLWPDISVGGEDRKTLLLRVPEPTLPPLVIEAVRHKYAQTAKFGYWVKEEGELTQEVDNRSKVEWVCVRWLSRQLFDRQTAPSVETQDATAESGDGEQSTVPMHDVGSAP